MRVTTNGMEIIIEYNNLLSVGIVCQSVKINGFGVWFMMRNDLSSISIRNEKKRHEPWVFIGRVKGVASEERRKKKERIFSVEKWCRMKNTFQFRIEIRINGFAENEFSIFFASMFEQILGTNDFVVKLLMMFMW